MKISYTNGGVFGNLFSAIGIAEAIDDKGFGTSSRYIYDEHGRAYSLNLPQWLRLRIQITTLDDRAAESPIQHMFKDLEAQEAADWKSPDTTPKRSSSSQHYK
jgi:hypothetical protein